MGQINWFDRKFEFSSNENIMPSVIERLEGTPLRLIEKLRKLSQSVLQLRPEGKWSHDDHHLAKMTEIVKWVAN